MCIPKFELLRRLPLLLQHSFPETDTIARQNMHLVMCVHFAESDIGGYSYEPEHTDQENAGGG